MTLNSWILLIQLIASAYLCGLVWLVQVVHYPMLADLNPWRNGESRGGKFGACERHARLITPVVAPAMLVELAIAIALVIPGPWSGNAAGLAWAGLVVVVLIWISTFFVQVPLHEKLAKGLDVIDGRTVGLLVRTNWVRTVLWSLRVVISAAMLSSAMR